jgi:hypothetical protein
METGESGVRISDLFDAIEIELSAAVRTLTPINCRRYLTSLPQDVDVVAVEPAANRRLAPHRLLTVT